MKKLLKEYRVELIALLVVLFGFFLLVEQLDIRVTVFRFISQAYNQIRAAGINIYSVVSNYAKAITLSDAIGWVIIIGASFFFFHRARYRFLLSIYIPDRTCPICGEAVRRVHRTSWDKFLQRVLFSKFLRYACRNEECRWSSIALSRHPGGKRPGTEKKRQ